MNVKNLVYLFTFIRTVSISRFNGSSYTFLNTCHATTLCFSKINLTLIFLQSTPFLTSIDIGAEAEETS